MGAAAQCSPYFQRTMSNVLSIWREYSQVFERVDLEEDVRVVVLASGLDKLFTAGLDCRSSPYLIVPCDRFHGLKP